MALKRITSIPLFQTKIMGSGSAGTTIDSDPIDLRDIAQDGIYSVNFNVGTSGGCESCGSCSFSYRLSQNYDGTYISPLNGTFGTTGSGSAGTSNVVAITPPLAPFMKIRVVVGTSGTSVVTASLNVR